jgi:hypothetical protein
MEPQITQTDDTDLDIVIITKHNKIIHKIYMKMNTLIKSTYGLLHEHNIALILTRVMRELNKESLYGFEKKNIAISIMVLLLDSLGTPDMVSKMTATAIADTVELIYSNSMHRYKKTGKCIIL